MDNNIIEKEDYSMQEEQNNISDVVLKQEESNDISNIISNEEMKNLMQVLFSEFDTQRKEAMDAYYIFKDMVINSGDFDSSQATKEALTALLKNAQDASNAKMRMFDSIMKSKIKQQSIQHAEINQSNVFIDMDRRSLLKELEKMKDNDSFVETINHTDEIEKEINSLKAKEQTQKEQQAIHNNKKEENIKQNIINNNEEIDFEIESGDFE